MKRRSDQDNTLIQWVGVLLLTLLVLGALSG